MQTKFKTLFAAIALATVAGSAGAAPAAVDAPAPVAVAAVSPKPTNAAPQAPALGCVTPEHAAALAAAAAHGYEFVGPAPECVPPPASSGK